ncbi:hypothetical protein IC620_09075 [Hazenella sp. IB182357]|uniref:Uncharacterized protein n=1 Tax=Polycladospora coralii TaxID=2771432 RepID=A0A926NAJ1_9BACL|nr:hypothetical protein [Polycladospora coralii]MBD1372507.1 hypothetical protein [Polycladospora coralii]
MISSRVNSVITKNKIKLSWTDLPDDDGIYDAYKDGKLVKQVSKPFFTDKNANKTATYKIVGSKRLPQSAIEEKEEALSKEDEDLFYEIKELGTIINFDEPKK